LGTGQTGFGLNQMGMADYSAIYGAAMAGREQGMGFPAYYEPASYGQTAGSAAAYGHHSSVGTSSFGQAPSSSTAAKYPSEHHTSSPSTQTSGQQVAHSQSTSLQQAALQQQQQQQHSHQQQLSQQSQTQGNASHHQQQQHPTGVSNLNSASAAGVGATGSHPQQQSYPVPYAYYPYYMPNQFQQNAYQSSGYGQPYVSKSGYPQYAPNPSSAAAGTAASSQKTNPLVTTPYAYGGATQPHLYQSAGGYDDMSPIGLDNGYGKISNSMYGQPQGGYQGFGLNSQAGGLSSSHGGVSTSGKMSGTSSSSNQGGQDYSSKPNVYDQHNKYGPSSSSGSNISSSQNMTSQGTGSQISSGHANISGASVATSSNVSNNASAGSGVGTTYYGHHQLGVHQGYPQQHFVQQNYGMGSGYQGAHRGTQQYWSQGQN